MTELTKAADDINTARTGELQNHQVATINEQILEHDMQIAANDEAVELMQAQIAARRKDTKKRERAQIKLRQQRDIFARAAFELRQVNMP